MFQPLLIKRGLSNQGVSPQSSAVVPVPIKHPQAACQVKDPPSLLQKKLLSHTQPQKNQ